MLHQPRYFTAFKRTTLVLFLVLFSAMAVMAADKDVPVAASLTATASGPSTHATVDQQPAGVQQKAAPAPTPAPRPGMTAGSVQQSDQGKRYGESGFVGEPINLNVVNADIRDILNYITEQYGVNFIMDASVKAVPVTVNVSEVPWNVALDSVLKANRLGVEVSGNILRVAATEVLAAEFVTNERIRESQLSASPLITEFIRLNYARATGSLQGTAGSSSDFSGGRPTGGVSSYNSSFALGAISGGGGEQGILPVIQRRLSKRGSVETDSRSNTLIITDVRENIEAVRQLIAILDQPEPQVEIETRIVIATHNFSRDLGVQLSAGVLNLGRGGASTFSTIPGGPSTTGASVPPLGAPATPPPAPGSAGTLFGIPGGINGGPIASAANTVIGLTTGIFGTAQISAIITAGETTGQVKTIATPRVTVLNNRTAEVHSGQQIPVQTLTGTSGATTVSTAFVLVPLSLKIIPQITDAGTVILQVTIENNTLNTSIAVGGVPGIDSQGMTSQVMVPDGGTTIMGGVLADQEGNTVNKTPGLGNIPIVGNLFKRKLVTKQSSEILFFITPHIYRPDYQGRPTSSVVGTGNRSVTIPQPVPLGNPQSNTPNQPQPQTAPQTTPVTQPIPGTPPQ